MSATFPETLATSGPDARRSAGERPGCFHCGEPCPDPSLVKDGKPFCCNGCMVVHDLLTTSGLGHFYDLSQGPGVRIRRPSGREQWSYLDDPQLQQKLLDFTDGEVSRVTLSVPQVHCVACVWLLENLFQLHPGIGRSQVNFSKREVAVTFAAKKIALSELAALMASLGYEPQLTLGELEPRRRSPVRRRLQLQVGVAGFAFGNIMLFSLPQYFGLDSFSGPLFHGLFGFLSLALALPVLVYSAADYWRSAWLSWKQRVLTLDVPIAAGLAALYLQSAFEIATRRGEGYLDSLAGLVFFLLCGRIFQRVTHERLAFDRDYKCFFPLSVLRLGVESEESVALSALAVGDRLRVRHGELIPADARLVAGPALVDYSFVTGESEPVAKAVGEYLYAGGKQVGGAIELEIVKPVSQSYLTSLWDHDAFRKERDHDLHTLTNRYSRRFTRIVVAVAVGAAVFWVAVSAPGRALRAFTSVLIVACPCALALAAPFTTGTAQRILARRQVFLKNGHVIERMAQVDTIVFDKTGTLTVTAPEVEFESFGAEGDGALTREERAWVASLAGHSTHPHAARIAGWCGEGRPAEPVHTFAETLGGGVEGEVAGKRVLLGSCKWLIGRGLPVPGTSQPDDRAGSGSTVWLGVDGRVRGRFRLTPALRSEAEALLARLSARYEVALLSGDNSKESARFRRLLGEQAQLLFEQSPVEKLEFIRGRQDARRTVMMVGDGLNDAGALRQSDVGVAVVERVGVFSPASDVILSAERVPQLGALLQLARRSVRIVYASFGISALYNAVGIGIAAAGILSPAICAVLMPLSSVSVVAFACLATGRAARRAGF